jgi:hypothetical protein
MKRLMCFVALAALAAPGWSQEVIHRRVVVGGPGHDATWVGDGPAIADAVFLHGPGMRFEGPPKKGAPYSAEAVTETVQALGDGNRIVRENRAKVYRDSEGRTRREETLGAVGPWAVAGEHPVRIFINDPVAGEHWVLEPENKIARKMAMPKIEEHVGALADVNVDVDVTVDAPEGAGPRVARRIERRELHVSQGAAVAGGTPAERPHVEDLGARTIEGVEAKGTKITRTIPAGEIGNERPIEVVFEQWRSEELGVDVMTKRRDPRSAETTYRLTNIQRTEPLPGLFQPPPDYEVKGAEGDVVIRRMERR